MMDDVQLKAEPENVAPPLHNYHNTGQEKMNLHQHYHKQTKKKKKQENKDQPRKSIIHRDVSVENRQNLFFNMLSPSTE